MDNGQTVYPPQYMEIPPPSDIGAERDCLGLLVVSPELWGDKVIGTLGPDDFTDAKLRAAFTLLRRVYSESRVFSRSLLEASLKGDEAASRFIAMHDLDEMIRYFPTAFVAGQRFIDRVREMSLRRQAVKSLGRCLAAAYDLGTPFADGLAATNERLATLTSQTITNDDGYSAIGDEVEATEAEIRNRKPGVLTGVPTGFGKLDELTCGLQPGELIIVGAHSSQGKSAFMLNVATHVAVSAGLPVLFMSLEMRRNKLIERVISNRANIAGWKIRDGRLNEIDSDNLETHVKQLAKSKIYMTSPTTKSINRLRTVAPCAVRRDGVKAIFIDYLQIIDAPRVENRQVSVSLVSAGLQKLAHELNVPVVVGSQLTKPMDKTKPHRPRLWDLRESGAIGQDADLVLILWRPGVYEQQGKAIDPDETPEQRRQREDAGRKTEVIVAKNRNGPLEDFELRFDYEYSRFVGVGESTVTVVPPVDRAIAQVEIPF